jgi:glycosyltransferase involved in cell wall biosynthesis
VKKRVLQFIGSFHQGGSELQAVDLTQLLKNEGSFEIFAATLNADGVLRPRMDAIGLSEIPAFPLTSFYNANFGRQLRRCIKYLRRNQIDIVHTHDFYTNVFGMAAARFAGTPVRIASKRETAGMRSGLQKMVETFAFRQASAIVVNSAAVRDHLASGSNGNKLHTIYNGKDGERFAVAADDRRSTCMKLGLPTDKKIRFITMVANLRHPVKNVPMLLRGAKRVLENHRDVHFIVAGEGELGRQLRESAENFGIADYVHFIGRCDDVPALLQISYACVLTSTAEGFSNSILEYLAAGKPVIATNVGGASEAVIDGQSGYLVASDDDQTLSARLIELLDNEMKANIFGAEGRRIVREKFSKEAQLSSTLRLYNSLLN